jgi:ribonuclease HI
MLFEEYQTEIKNLILTADGGSRGNPGPSDFVFVIWTDKINFLPSSDQKKIEAALVQAEILYLGSEYIGNTTNNQAEWRGLIAGLEYIQSNFKGINSLSIALDSELVVKQLKGIYKVKNPGLIELHQKAGLILNNFKNVSIIHIYRHLNKAADELVNKTLDEIAKN